MSRTKRSMVESERQAILTRIKAWRQDCIGIQASAPIMGDVYRAVGGITAAIDELAGAITGNREHFWTKQASISEGPRTGRAAQDEEVDDTGRSGR